MTTLRGPLGHDFRLVPNPGAALAPILTGCALMFAVIQFGPGWLMQWLDQPAGSILATAAMLVVVFAVERVFYARTPVAAAVAVGLIFPRLPALAAAAIVSVAMLAFFPLFALGTGAAIAVRGDWWWLLMGAIAHNGIAEETLFRGYVFGGLRREGFGFVAAATISLVIFAAVHLFLFIGNPPVVAMLGVGVAVATAFPLAFLYERAGNSIWPPALVHVATHTIRFVDVAEPFTTAALIAWLLLQLALPFAVFLFATSLLRPAAP